MSGLKGGEQRLVIPILDGEWLLQNHRVHHHERARRVRMVREKAGWLARVGLCPMATPVAVYSRALIRQGSLPDSDAIAPLVKAILDGIVDAGIIPDDGPEEVILTGYGRPRRDRTLTPHGWAIDLLLTTQLVPF